jgi:hypothetical protein
VRPSHLRLICVLLMCVRPICISSASVSSASYLRPSHLHPAVSSASFSSASSRGMFDRFASLVHRFYLGYSSQPAFDHVFPCPNHCSFLNFVRLCRPPLLTVVSLLPARLLEAIQAPSCQPSHLAISSASVSSAPSQGIFYSSQPAFVPVFPCSLTIAPK